MQSSPIPKLPKILNLASVAIHHPKEGLERVRNFVDAHRQHPHTPPEYTSQDPAAALAALELALSCDLRSHLHDAALQEIERTAQDNFETLGDRRPFDTNHNADRNLARTCFALVRALRPSVLVETGVCYGFTSSYLLQALQSNQTGRLHSIDLPPLARDADYFVGSVIPPALRDRWTLYRGDARHLLPPLLDNLGTIDFFLHDSLHTHQHMRFEFEHAWAKLRSRGLLMSDDIEDNPAFLEHISRPDVRCSVVIKFAQGEALFGVAVKC